jgi:hypothetical protein
MTRSVLPRLAVFVALSLLTGAGQPPQGQKDAQSTYEPRSDPGAGQKFLQQFVGDWEVAKTFYPRAGNPARSQGECKQTMIHGGRFLQSEFVFGRGGEKTTGLGLIGYDSDTGKFTSVWTDSRATRMSLRHSQDKFNGREIVLSSAALDAGGREARRSRTVTRVEDHGRTIVHRQYALGPDGQERLMMELLMTRKPAGGPQAGTPPPAK